MAENKYPRADALRAMREAKYEFNQKMMKQARPTKAETITGLKVVAAEAAKKRGKPRGAKKKSNRQRGD
jgi:hypothetical protein